MNEIERATYVYETNRERISKALREAGGNPDVILSDPAYRKVLTNFAANGIEIHAEQCGAYPADYFCAKS